MTAIGTAAFDTPARADAELVRRLRDAGAVLIGKTNLPELAIYGFTESKTWGTTRNPWDRSRTTGGSSGGSAAAVAAGLVGAASGVRRRRLDPDPRRPVRALRAQVQRGRVPLGTRRTARRALARPHRRRLSHPDRRRHGAVAGRHRRSRRCRDAERAPFTQAAAAAPGSLRIAVSTSPPRLVAPPIVTDEVVAAVDEAARALARLGSPTSSVTIRTTAWSPPRSPPATCGGIRDDVDGVPTIPTGSRRARAASPARGALNRRRASHPPGASRARRGDARRILASLRALRRPADADRRRRRRSRSGAGRAGARCGRCSG